MPLRDAGFEIPSAVVESVSRRRPGKVSIGDRATVRLDPGILNFIETRIPGAAIPIGAGYQARFNIPFGIAATAAYALIGPEQSDRVSWSGFDVELEWRDAAGLGESLLAGGEVLAHDPGLAVFAIWARTADGKELLTGRLRLRAVRDGKTVGTSLLARSTRPQLAWGEGSRPRLSGYSLLASIDSPARMELSQIAAVLVTVANDSDATTSVVVSPGVPPAHGISIEESPASTEIELAPHSWRTLRWKLRADRPDEVNRGEPWPVEITARGGGKTETSTLRIAVRDPRPGRTFYVLTEDCETFDGGSLTGDYGALASLGSGNNFMDPEDYRVQMIQKPDRMNQIAERHGARWTHFWCVPQRFAADWAASQSSTGEWPRIAAALDESVRRGSLRHEYAPHIHFDYEPESRHPPQPRLLYDAATDGILPNEYYDPVANPRHHYHDWDGSGRGIAYVKRLGDLADSDSKAGSLHKCLVWLARMQANRRCPIVARTGGLDFGIDAEDQLVSTAAYEANGLLANSDVRLADAAQRGKGAYYCDPGDRMREAESPLDGRLVELAIALETDFRDPDAVNRWFAAAAESAAGPGVRLITVMTHAMFMRGSPDPFRSLAGGSFAGLDRHLEWVRSQHPEVRFATASEALEEYIDYYTPRLVARVTPVLCGGDPERGVFEYPVRLLGGEIRVDERHPAEICIQAPPLFEQSAVERLRVIAAGEILAAETGFDGLRQPAVSITLCSRPKDLRLEVVLRPASIAETAALFAESTEPRYREPPEPARAPLFRLRAPGEGFASTDLLRLLMNPLAGHAEPLGRRIHPLGVFIMGAALTAALETAGEEQPWQPVSYRPAKLRLRWRKAAAMDGDLQVDCRAGGQGNFAVRIRDQEGDVVADGEVELVRIQAIGSNSPGAAGPSSSVSSM